MGYLSSVVFHTVILKMLLKDKRTKKCGLTFYKEYNVGVCIIEATFIDFSLLRS